MGVEEKLMPYDNTLQHAPLKEKKKHTSGGERVDTTD